MASDFKKRSLSMFPAGSNGEYAIPATLIPILDRGLGCRVWDADGREFLDMTMAWGAALVGHAHPKVIEAATSQARNGGNFAAVTVRSLELAERIQALSPCVERIRFVASGTEATLLCLRIAHTATGRAKILKFEGAYHGQHPVGVASLLGANPQPFPQADAAGTGAAWIERDVLVAPFNDLATTEQIINAHKTEIAAIIVEPLHRCIVPKDGFLQGLRALASQTGIVLIFDEVVTGFRLAPGGAQEYYGVTPDLAAFGKALGGGFPIGAYGGKTELMDVVDEFRLPGPRYVWSASTGGGNPVSAAAALATLDLLSEKGVYASLHGAGRLLRKRMSDILAECGEMGQVLGDGPIAQAAFSPSPVIDQRSWLASNRARGRAVMLELLESGVFLNPMGTKLYLSLAHEECVLDEFAEHFRRAIIKTKENSDSTDSENVISALSSDSRLTEQT